MPPAGISGISELLGLQITMNLAEDGRQIVFAQSMPKPRWPPASGPSTTT
jgi:hypothetical protein